ncbi:MAG: hypothetical protein KDD38_03745, partial [Bdellovibrionales bacterium]|nr:hypothetical protein [Bdellovibrionales bacterium]
MGRNYKILLANFLKSIALLFKGFFALSFVLLSACGGGRGGSEDANGNPIGLGLEIRKVSGDNQGVKKGLAYPLPLVAKITAPDGYPVPDMTVDCTEITNTDAVITGPTSFVTDTSGIISTTVLAASTYDQTTKIECRIRNSPNLAVFTLETVFTVDRIEWADSGAPDPTPINPPNEPPAVYTASHNVPMTPFQVKMIDADDGVSLIDLTGGTKHWITVSAVSPAQAPIGTLTATFQAGFAEFSNVNYIKADTITLRATHNVSGKTVDKVITINPNATTRSIAILPGQTYTNGTMTLAEAVTGVLGAFNVDNNFNVEVRATDDYFNTTSYAGAVSLQSPNDLTDTEPAASNFVAGVETFTMSPVQAKSGYTVLPVTALTDNASTTFTMQPGAPANLITRLPGQTFNPGQTSLAAAITGAPTQQVAGA